MPATYYTKRGQGHSRRGAEAREMGARPWSRLPHSLKRGLKSAQAEELRISFEWHHTGKYATEVYVYYPEQVQAFWAVIDDSGYTAEELLDMLDNRAAMAATGAAASSRRLWRTVCELLLMCLLLRSLVQSISIVCAHTCMRRLIGRFAG